MKDITQVSKEIETVQRLKGLVADYYGDLQTYNRLIAIPKLTSEQENHLDAILQCLPEYSEEIISICKEIKK